MSELNSFQKTLRKENTERPPVWFMRQAGRYHSHYQGLRKKYSFIDLCKIPEVACEVTMGPINEFNFDAAILFSDLLFPLEEMGMGLRYEPGPKLDWYLKEKTDLSRLKSGASLAKGLQYQADAMKLIRKTLSPEKGLLGFVGGPLTLYFYAVAGSHQSSTPEMWKTALDGMKNGLYLGFCEKLEDFLAENMALQARAGADTVAMLDTCGGEVDVDTYSEIVRPTIDRVLKKYHAIVSNVPVTYYSKGTDERYWKTLVDSPIAAIGVDWRVDLAQTLDRWSDRFVIQGNIDPDWMLLPANQLEEKVRAVFSKVKALPASKRRGWVSGLGHGVLQTTPESNVHLWLKIQKEMFS